MDVSAYLERINYHSALEPTGETLRALQQAHLLSVPFENLDIALGRRIVLDETLLFDKIVNRRRGGFCYELNGLFAALLRELRFDVHRLSARVSNSDGGYGIEFDHMTLSVQLEERWLVDVGFGDAFREPLRLDQRGEQSQPEGKYRVADEGDHLTYLWLNDGVWTPQYIFTLQSYTLADFADGCQYHQTSPRSSFTQRRVCSRATPDGRVTLSDGKLIITSNGARQERTLDGPEEYRAVLCTHFGVAL
jgi:N-hydroxyarylamine O-acetyltransferase